MYGHVLRHPGHVITHTPPYQKIKGERVLTVTVTVTTIKYMAPAGIALSCHLERMLLYRPVLRITHVIHSTLYGCMDHTPHSMGR